MVKKIFIFAFLFMCIFTTFCYANEVDLKEQFEQSGVNELIDNAPNNVKVSDENSILKYNIPDLFSQLFNSIKQSITNPFKTLIIIIGAILVFALLNTFSNSFNQVEFAKIFEIVVAISICIIIITPISEIIKSSENVISECNKFTASFLPVFSSVLLASGKPVSASIFSGIMLTVIHIITTISNTILVPFLGIYLSLNIIGSVNSQINIEGICNLIRNIVIWVIGISFTIFLGLLSVQSLVANSTDTLSSKTAKFMLGSFIPIIGASISEAFNSIQGCLNVIKSFVGTFGIICFISIFLPILLQILAYIVVVSIANGLGQLFNLSVITKIMKATNNTLTILLMIIVSILIFLTVATTIILLIGGST